MVLMRELEDEEEVLRGNAKRLKAELAGNKRMRMTAKRPAPSADD